MLIKVQINKFPFISFFIPTSMTYLNVIEEDKPFYEVVYSFAAR